jgi:hypothetical protein
VKKALVALALALLPASALAQSVGVVAAPAVTGGVVLKTVGARLYGVNVVSGASAGYVMIFDAPAVPADGAVVPAYCLPLAANTGLDASFRAAPINFVTGISVAFSTTGCYTKTASATAYIAGSVQ